MNLLHTAHLVERNLFDQLRILKIRDSGVVEGYVRVFADAEEYDVRRIFRHQLRVSYAGVGTVGVEIIHLAEGHPTENMLVEIMPEALRLCAGEADIFVHVEGSHAAPVDVRLERKGAKRLILRRSRGKYRIDGFARREPASYVIRAVMRRRPSGGSRVGEYSDRQPVKGVAFNGM